MHIINVETFGFIMFPQESTKKLTDDYEQLIGIKTEIIGKSFTYHFWSYEEYVIII